MGRSKSRIIPLIKLLKIFWSPKPSPILRAPKTTVRDVELTPIIRSDINMPMPQIRYVVMVVMESFSPVSMPLPAKNFSRSILRHRRVDSSVSKSIRAEQTKPIILNCVSPMGIG